LNKIESLRVRAKALTNLREEVALPLERDLKKEQWEALMGQLTTVSNGLLQRLRTYTDRFLADRENPSVRRQLVEFLGRLELEVTESFNFYDTYMDLLTQRLSKPIGEMLRGCDAIAFDGFRRGFLADITVPPIVYCERGFGASTLRESINILPNVPNPMQFIAIPYSRLLEKYNLISIYHEVGHQALVKLNFPKLFEKVFDEQLARAGATDLLRSLFINWSKELGPDFWAFCLTGMAQTASLRDVLFLPQKHTTCINTSQQHPPAYIRFLVSVHWCRHLWGKGDWDGWEKEWKEIYPLSSLDKITRDVVLSVERFLPLIAKIYCDTRYKKLDNKPLASLFSLEDLSPAALKAMANDKAIETAAFKSKPIGFQLAVFRLMREDRQYKQSYLDARMREWLTAISN
jgi:hypothetical protein